MDNIVNNGLRLKTKESMLSIWIHMHKKGLLGIATLLYAALTMVSILASIRLLEHGQPLKQLLIIDVVLIAHAVILVLKEFYDAVARVLIEYHKLSKLPLDMAEISILGLQSIIDYALFMRIYLVYNYRGKLHGIDLNPYSSSKVCTELGKNKLKLSGASIEKIMAVHMSGYWMGADEEARARNCIEFLMRLSNRFETLQGDYIIQELIGYSVSDTCIDTCQNMVNSLKCNDKFDLRQLRASIEASNKTSA